LFYKIIKYIFLGNSKIFIKSPSYKNIIQTILIIKYWGRLFIFKKLTENFEIESQRYKIRFQLKNFKFKKKISILNNIKWFFLKWNLNFVLYNYKINYCDHLYKIQNYYMKLYNIYWKRLIDPIELYICRSLKRSVIHVQTLFYFHKSLLSHKWFFLLWSFFHYEYISIKNSLSQ